MDHQKIKRVPEKKNIYFCFTDYAKAFVWITINCGKFWKRCEYKTTWPASWEICMQVRKQQLELDMEQQTASKWEKKYFKAIYCHPAYLTYIQSEVKSLSRVRLFSTPWTVAYQAPPSMGFSRQESWNGLPFPSPIHKHTVETIYVITGLICELFFGYTYNSQLNFGVTV